VLQSEPTGPFSKRWNMRSPCGSFLPHPAGQGGGGSTRRRLGCRQAGGSPPRPVAPKHTGMAWQGMAGQGRAGQGRAGHGRAWHGMAGHGRAGQGRAGQVPARPSSSLLRREGRGSPPLPPAWGRHVLPTSSYPKLQIEQVAPVGSQLAQLTSVQFLVQHGAPAPQSWQSAQPGSRAGRGMQGITQRQRQRAGVVRSVVPFKHCVASSFAVKRM